MREILFRGKPKNLKKYEWVHGQLLHHSKLLSKVYSDELDYPVGVIPETVGQFTGLTDKNGKKIFEGDIIKGHTGRILTVKFGQHYDEEYNALSYGWFVFDNEGELSFGEDWGGHEVIGNIHDTPELLEV